MSADFYKWTTQIAPVTLWPGHIIHSQPETLHADISSLLQYIENSSGFLILHRATRNHSGNNKLNLGKLVTRTSYTFMPWWRPDFHTFSSLLQSRLGLSWAWSPSWFTCISNHVNLENKYSTQSKSLDSCPGFDCNTMSPQTPVVCGRQPENKGSASVCETSPSNMTLLSTIVTVSQIKLDCLLNSLLYFIGLLVTRNERQYLVWFIFIKLLFSFF